MNKQAEPQPAMLLDRVGAFTDAVLAIVITILVLGFEVPDHDFEKDRLSAFYVKLLEAFMAYVVSFAVVGAYWVQHLAFYHYVRRGTRSLVWLNILFLFPLSFLPFLTTLRTEHHSGFLPNALFAGANVFCGAVMYWMWSYAKSRGLAPRCVPIVDRSMRRRILAGMALNVAGAAAALIDPHLSIPFFLAMPLLFLSHRVVDSHWSDGGEARSEQPLC